MLRFFSLSSGSCGNCYYLGTDEHGIIIDAGVSLRRVKKVFPENGIDMGTVNGVLVTHDHLDHIRFLGSFCKRLHMPAYMTGTVGKALARHPVTASSTAGYAEYIPDDGTLELPGMSVRCFEVPHDATQTVGYSIETAGHRFVIMTDIGRMTDEAAEYASKADTLVIESNYDMDMLMSSPMLWARKFDERADNDIIDTICHRLKPEIFHDTGKAGTGNRSRNIQ